MANLLCLLESCRGEEEPIVLSQGCCANPPPQTHPRGWGSPKRHPGFLLYNLRGGKIEFKEGKEAAAGACGRQDWIDPWKGQGQAGPSWH